MSRCRSASQLGASSVTVRWSQVQAEGGVYEAVTAGMSTVAHLPFAAWVERGLCHLRPRLTPVTVPFMTTESSVIEAELHRIVSGRGARGGEAGSGARLTRQGAVSRILGGV